MATDTATAIVDKAWGLISQSRESDAGAGSFTRTRVERALSLAAAVGFVVLGTQSFIAALGATDERPGWHLTLMLLAFLPLGAMIVACLVGRAIRVSAGGFVVAFTLTLLLWPIATVGSAPVPTEQPWIWYQINLATMASGLAFPFALQVVATIVIPLLFGVVRLVQAGFAAEFWFPVGLDVSFALILGGVLITLGWMFRSMATNVDATRARAVDSYARAAAADAAEKERLAVAALMHDSVLAALIAAARAETERERTLAVAMAREALTRLANAEQDATEGSDEPRSGAWIADQIEAGSAELGGAVTVDRRTADGATDIPGRVARALSLAAMQAVANSLQHAAGEGLGVVVRGDERGIRIEVRDEGAGFDLEEVPEDRLGIRASILARVAAVGGTAQVDSGPTGTVVRLSWRGVGA
ncbi:ATP-binding protein [Microbacterium awajiense]|uniref:ATP-binding protein n=1 Tax=Microbacterium awajiense TaxID=415214 RepID=A0ABP7AGF7_9MICO